MKNRKELWKNERSERLAGDEGEEERERFFEEEGRISGRRDSKKPVLLPFAPLAVLKRERNNEWMRKT